MFHYNAKPPDQAGGAYDPSSLSMVQTYINIPTDLRNDPNRFRHLGDFTLALAPAVAPYAPARGTILFRSANLATNGWTDMQDLFLNVLDNLPSVYLNDLFAGLENSNPPIRFVIRSKTKESFAEFDLAATPQFYERNTTREISYANTKGASQETQSSFPYISTARTIHPQNVGLTGTMWKSGDYAALSSLYPTGTSYFLWYMSSFMRFSFLATETISTRGTRYEYMLPTGAYANANTFPARLPSSLTSRSSNPMRFVLKRDITIVNFRPIVRKQAGAPIFGELYEVYWVYAGRNNYLNDFLISSGIITQSITDIGTNNTNIQTYVNDIDALNIEITTSSLMSSAAIQRRDDAQTNKTISCSLYSTNLNYLNSLPSTLYISSLSSYQLMLNDYIKISTFAYNSTQSYQVSLATAMSSFSSLQSQYKASIDNFNLQTTIKAGLDVSLPIIQRISTLYATSGTTALSTIWTEYPNLSTLIDSYVSTIKAYAPPPTPITTPQFSTYYISAGKAYSTGTTRGDYYISAGKAYSTTSIPQISFDQYLTNILGIQFGGDTSASIENNQTGGGDSISPEYLKNPYFRIGRITQLISLYEDIRVKRQDRDTKRATYLVAASEYSTISSIRMYYSTMDISLLQKWNKAIADKSTLDGLYISSLQEYNTSYIAFTTIYNQVAYLSSYRNEIAAFSTLERLQQRQRTLQEAADVFNAGYDGTALYSTAIRQSGGATNADVTMALQTLNILVGSAQTSYEATQGIRIDAEKKITNDRSGPLESTIASYDNLIDKYLNDITTNMDKISTSQSTLKWLSTRWRTAVTTRVTSTSINNSFMSTSTFYGNSLQRLRSTLEGTTGQGLATEINMQLGLMNLGDTLTGISTNMRYKTERIDQIADLLKRYEEAQRTYSTIIDYMKSYATLFEQPYVAPQALPVVNVQQIRTLYGIPNPTTQVGGNTIPPPTYTTSGQIAALNATRAQKMSQFVNTTGILNSTFLSMSHKELNYYSTILLEISSSVQVDLSLKRYDFAMTREYDYSADPMSTFGYRANPNYMKVIGLRDSINTLLDQMEVERSLKLYYIQTKALYDLQMYYSKTPLVEPNTMTKTDFNVLKTQYDFVIQMVNSNIFVRQQYQQNIKSQIIDFSTNTIIDPNVLLTFTQSTIVATKDGDTQLVQSRQKALFDMSFNLVPLRSDYFSDPVVLQLSQTPPCPVVPSTPLIQDRPIPITPTTTISPLRCGTTIRYIDIEHVADTFYLTQVIAVDRLGRNVAFGRPVTLSPATFSTAKSANAQILTNGLTYSTELQTMSPAVVQNFTEISSGISYTERIRIDLGQSFEITLIGIYIVANSGYNTTGLRVTTYNSALTLAPPTSSGVNPYVVTGNISPVFIDRRAAGAAATCPITILPLRRGVCGVMAEYIRIYPPWPIPAGFRFEFSQIAVIGTDGSNLALGKTFSLKTGSGAGTLSTTDSQGRTYASVIASGDYVARQAARCLSQSVTQNDYLVVDIGDEFDIAAVHIYNRIGGTNLAGCRVMLYTNDMMLADRANAITNDRREILDFRYSGSSVACPILPRWPPSYGEAGIKARYIHVFKPASTTPFGFMMIEAINREGRNVALGRPVTIYNGTTTTKTLIVNSVMPSIETIITPVNTALEAQITIDLGAITEVCGVQVTGLTTTDMVGLRIEHGIPYTITFQSTTAIVTTLGDSFATLLAMYPVGTAFSFIAGATRYRMTFNPSTTTTTRSVVLQTETAPGTFVTTISIQTNAPLQIYLASNQAYVPAERDAALIEYPPYQLYTIYIQTLGTSATLWRTGDHNTLVSVFGIGNPFFVLYNNTLMLRIQLLSTTTTTTRSVIIEKETTPGSGTWITATTADLPVNATSSTTTPARILALGITYIYDGRYDPEGSKFPISETTIPIQYGEFGVFAQHALIPATAILATTDYKLVDSTGKDICTIDTGFTTSIVTYDGASYMKVSLSRVWEIVAVCFNGGAGRMVALNNCNDMVVWTDVTGPSVYPTTPYFIADFRRQSITDRSRSPVDIYPYPMRFGPFNQGVMTRYIQVEPPDSTKGLYISQIIAVNACGRNSAFEREVFASSGGTTATFAVDGRYEDQLSQNSSPDLLYQNYLQKPLANSYQSGPVAGGGLRWITDLGKIFSLTQTTGTITGVSDKETFCSKMISNTACGGSFQLDSSYEHEINCVIFVAPKEKKADCIGSIVKLLDGNGQVVGIRRVTRLIRLFGVDFLDFRRDVSVNLGTAIVEVPQRPVGRGPNNCGIMAMFVRIEQRASSNPGATTAPPIRLSQIFVLDHLGRNIALYKPTKSNTGPVDVVDTSFRAVDGRYYVKDAAGSYVSSAGVDQYIEVNLGCEMPVTKVFLLNAAIDSNDAAYFGSLVIKVYNQTRDLILVQSATTLIQGNNNYSGELQISDPVQARAIDKAGVNIQERFFQRAFDEGVIPTLPGVTLKQLPPIIPLNRCNPSADLRSMLTRGTSQYKGVMASFIRIYNPNSYIQISQLMVYDQNLTNICRGIDQSRVFATHALPGRQPERAVDGVGGYFHVGRPEAQCYISENKKYEFWQLDVRDPTTGQPREIVAIRYIPPSSNRSRNRGTRFQLLQATAPPVPTGSILQRAFEVTWPQTPRVVGPLESTTIQFRDSNTNNIYLQFTTIFKENYIPKPAASVVHLNSMFGSTWINPTQVDLSQLGLTQDGGQLLYIIFRETSILFINPITNYQYTYTPTGIPGGKIATDKITNDSPLYAREIDAGAISQYVVSEFVLNADVYDQMIDFRQPILNPRGISEILSPKIADLTLAPPRAFMNPAAIAQDSVGSIYVADGQYIYKFQYSRSLRQFLTGDVFAIVDMGSGVTINTLTMSNTNTLWFSLVGMGNNIWFLNNVNTYTATNITGNNPTYIAQQSIIGSYNIRGLYATSTTLYITKYETDGALYSYDIGTGVTTLRKAGLNQPAGMTIRTESGKDYLYICCGGDFKVRKFDIAASFREILPSIGIGISDVNTQNISEKIYTYFKSPYSITTDPATNTLYITDLLAHKIFYIPPDPSVSVDAKVYTLAGTGSPGYFTPTDGPAIDALLNMPTQGIFHSPSGDYIFTDLQNGKVRAIQIDQVATTTTFTDKVIPQNQWSTTTIPGRGIAALPALATIPRAFNRERDTIKELANTGRVQTKPY